MQNSRRRRRAINPTCSNLRILLVDANDHTRDAATLALSSRGHVVVAAADWRDVEQSLGSMFDVVVTDVTAPMLENGEIVHRLRRAHPKAGLVVVSSGFLLTSRPLALALGADIFVERPIPILALEEAIWSAHAQRIAPAV